MKDNTTPSTRGFTSTPLIVRKAAAWAVYSAVITAGVVGMTMTAKTVDTTADLVSLWELALSVTAVAMGFFVIWCRMAGQPRQPLLRWAFAAVVMLCAVWTNALGILAPAIYLTVIVVLAVLCLVMFLLALTGPNTVPRPTLQTDI